MATLAETEKTLPVPDGKTGESVDSRRLQWGVVVGAFAVGCACIAWGGLVDDGYWSSVLSNVGVAVALVVPLYLVQQRVSRQVEEVGKQTKEELGSIRQDTDVALEGVGSRLQEMETSLAEVSEELQALDKRAAAAAAGSQTEEREKLLRPVRAVREVPSREAVMDALHAADDQQVLPLWETERGRWCGVHLALPTEDYEATISKVDTEFTPWALMVEIAARGSEFIRIEWKILWEPETFFIKLNASLRERYGDRAPTVSPSAVLEAFAGAIGLALDQRLSLGQWTTWRLIGTVGPWVVSTDGLAHQERAFASFDEVAAAPIAPPVPADAPDLDVLVDAWPLVYRWLREDSSIVAHWVSIARRS